jgi:hypothetical protein
VADKSIPGGTFWIAVPGRSVCPPPPQPPENDEVSSFEDDEGTQAARSRNWFPDNRGVVSIVEQGDHSIVNISNTRHGESS